MWRAAAHVMVSTLFAYLLAFGRTQTGLPPGVTVIAGGGVPTVQNFEQPPRYMVQLFVQVQNLTNHPNYQGYSGTLTSPFFGRPPAVSSTRKVDAGINITF